MIVLDSEDESDDFKARPQRKRRSLCLSSSRLALRRSRSAGTASPSVQAERRSPEPFSPAPASQRGGGAQVQGATPRRGPAKAAAPEASPPQPAKKPRGRLSNGGTEDDAQNILENESDLPNFSLFGGFEDLEVSEEDEGERQGEGGGEPSSQGPLEPPSWEAEAAGEAAWPPPPRTSPPPRPSPPRAADVPAPRGGAGPARRSDVVSLDEDEDDDELLVDPFEENDLARRKRLSAGGPAPAFTTAAAELARGRRASGQGAGRSATLEEEESFEVLEVDDDDDDDGGDNGNGGHGGRKQDLWHPAKVPTNANEGARGGFFSRRQPPSGALGGGGSLALSPSKRVMGPPSTISSGSGPGERDRDLSLVLGEDDPVSDPDDLFGTFAAAPATMAPAPAATGAVGQSRLERSVAEQYARSPGRRFSEGEGQGDTRWLARLPNFLPISALLRSQDHAEPVYVQYNQQFMYQNGRGGANAEDFIAESASKRHKKRQQSDYGGAGGSGGGGGGGDSRWITRNGVPTFCTASQYLTGTRAYKAYEKTKGKGKGTRKTGASTARRAAPKKRRFRRK